MLRFDRDTLQSLVSVQEFPCVSIYLPVLREGNDVTMSQIRLRTLLRQAEDHLRGYDLTVPKSRAFSNQPVIFWSNRFSGRSHPLLWPCS